MHLKKKKEATKLLSEWKRVDNQNERWTNYLFTFCATIHKSDAVSIHFLYKQKEKKKQIDEINLDVTIGRRIHRKVDKLNCPPIYHT